MSPYAATHKTDRKRMTKESKTTIIDGMNSFERAMKRALDIVGSLIGLICSSPVFLAIIIAQRTEGNGPILYKQERTGLHGKPFNILKFRTMNVEAEEDGPQLAQDDDERITKVGRFLRTHHLDELPQLINVLRGDMTFVGYRPERPYFIKQICALRPDYELLYISRPGMTSNATIHNGYTYTMEKMIRRLDMDLDYLEHRNLWIDAKIMMETMLFFITGKSNT
jgi:lipopolysaccharide/colanic/teichoic acid biosynthesis glycosyltransferase